MDTLTQDLADLIPVSENLKKENDQFKLEIESLKQTIEDGENERIQMLRNDIQFSRVSTQLHVNEFYWDRSESNRDFCVGFFRGFSAANTCNVACKHAKFQPNEFVKSHRNPKA